MRLLLLALLAAQPETHIRNVQTFESVGADFSVGDDLTVTDDATIGDELTADAAIFDSTVAACTGDVGCIDADGSVGGQRTTDAAPQGRLFRAQVAFAGGTQSAATLVLAGGQDETLCAIDGADPSASCAGDNDTITVTVLDSNGASTATVLTEGTEWTASASVANTCASLATAVDALAGVGATCTSPNVLFTLDSTTAAVKLAESTAGCTTVATGTAGAVVIAQDGAATAPALRGTDADTGIYFVPASGRLLISANGTQIVTVQAAGFEVAGQFFAPTADSDLTSSCTVGAFAIDTATTPEICYCQATNTWYCAAFDDLTGPAD